MFKEIKDFKDQGNEEDIKTQPQDAPQRKRIRHESTSSQGPQAYGEWVGQLFDYMSLMETNFNAHFDQVDASIARLQHDVHYHYEQQGYTCAYAPFIHPPPPPPPQ